MTQSRSDLDRRIKIRGLDGFRPERAARRAAQGRLRASERRGRRRSAACGGGVAEVAVDGAPGAGSGGENAEEGEDNVGKVMAGLRR